MDGDATNGWRGGSVKEYLVAIEFVVTRHGSERNLDIKPLKTLYLINCAIAPIPPLSNIWERILRLLLSITGGIPCFGVPCAEISSTSLAAFISFLKSLNSTEVQGQQQVAARTSRGEILRMYKQAILS